MSLQEDLADFAGSISLAATDAPDNYAYWSHWTYETHMLDLRELWAKIKPQISRDAGKAEIVEMSLTNMFAAFELGNKEGGRREAWSIYNSHVESLR